VEAMPVKKTVTLKRENEKLRLNAVPAGKSEQATSEAYISDIDINEVLAGIARDDLLVASALIDVRVSQEGDSLKLDFSGATKAAEVAMAGARARGILESAFGLHAGESYDENGLGASNPSDSATVTGTASPVEAISARLGADILISRRLDAENNGTGDIEDEQF